MAHAHQHRNTRDDPQQRLVETDRLYEQYAKPFEREHQGKYIAVSPNGRTMLGKKLYELVVDAEREFGPGSFIFKLGERAAATWRWISSA